MSVEMFRDLQDLIDTAEHIGVAVVVAEDIEIVTLPFAESFTVATNTAVLLTE